MSAVGLPLLPLHDSALCGLFSVLHFYLLHVRGFSRTKFPRAHCGALGLCHEDLHGDAHVNESDDDCHHDEEGSEMESEDGRSASFFLWFFYFPFILFYFILKNFFTPSLHLGIYCWHLFISVTLWHVVFLLLFEILSFFLSFLEKRQQAERSPITQTQRQKTIERASTTEGG